MKVYAPEGAYPEGYSYWGYGTTYNLMLIDALKSFIHSDYGLTQQEGFLSSAKFIQHMIHVGRFKSHSSCSFNAHFMEL